MTEKNRGAARSNKRPFRRGGSTASAGGQPSCLTPAEHDVLDAFRKYLMTPGKMLCFAGQDLESLRDPLVQLIDKGLLVAERYRGGYSLTDTGFAAMKDGEGSGGTTPV